MSLESFDRILRFVYSEPRFVATVEWHRDYGLRFVGWPREEMEHYVATGEHVDPDRRIEIVGLDNEPIDFGWWEPRYDLPGRREQTRRREAGLA